MQATSRSPDWEHPQHIHNRPSTNKSLFCLPRFRWLLGLTTLAFGFQVSGNNHYPAVAVEMSVQQVSAHVYYVQGVSRVATANYGFVSNAAFVVTDEGVVVFDTLGTPSLGAMFISKIRGITDQPILRVYNSHYHADHFYGNEAFVGPNTEFIAPRGAERYLTGETASQRLEERKQSLHPWVNDSTRLIYPDRYLVSEEKFTLGGVGLRAVNLGSAHSDGDLILYVESDDVLLSGDIIFDNRIPFIGSTNTREWLEILAQLNEINVKSVIPGHGSVSDNPQKIIQLTYQYLAFLRQIMSEAIAQWIPFDEVYESTDWSAYMEYPAFIEANRQNAYGVYLSMEEESLE